MCERGKTQEELLTQSRSYQGRLSWGGVPEPGPEVGGSPSTEEAWSLGLFKWLKSTEFRFQGRKQGAQRSEG